MVPKTIYNSLIWGSLLSLAVLLSTGCGLINSKETIIKNVVDSGNEQRSSVVTPDGIFGDYRAYRNGEADEVVFEYKLRKDVQVGSVEDAKKEISKGFSEGEAAAELKMVVNAGITLTFLYIDADGGEVLRHSMNSEVVK